MALNDYTLTMNAGYKGDFATFANSINDVQKKLLYIQDIVEEVSLGDISELENIKKTGLYSENDRLTPAFINMMEAIQKLIDETVVFSEAAENGNLNARGDVERFKGEYGNIIMGFNSTLDAVAKPMKEVIEVMSQIAEGNLSVAIKGDYKGNYAILANTVNATVEVLNNVIDQIGITIRNRTRNLDLPTVRDYKGDFGIISDSLNEIINSLNQILGTLILLRTGSSGEGKFLIQAKSCHRFGGTGKLY